MWRLACTYPDSILMVGMVYITDDCKSYHGVNRLSAEILQFKSLKKNYSIVRSYTVNPLTSAGCLLTTVAYFLNH